MKGFQFSKYTPSNSSDNPFEKLLDLLKELLVYTSGNVSEALDWMNELDKEYKLTDNDYGMGDFIEDLKKKGYLDQSEPDAPQTITSKMEQSIRKSALDQIFGKIKKSGKGNHRTPHLGRDGETLPETRSYQYGDSLDNIALTESLKNAQSKYGLDQWNLQSDDLLVREKAHSSSTNTVLMIDISHSMILYGEDRITPAKKVAMALAEYIKTYHPKDHLDVIVFGNDAWKIEIKDLPYLQVGPYHTNTVAGLQLAQDLLRRRKAGNKQIMMITDGKPSCLKEPGGYYKNSFGLDRKIVNKTLNEAAACRRAGIQVTTFMIATDSYLQQFIEEFSRAANGKAFYSGLNKLGAFIIHDYATNKRKKR
jgi:Ca-activated chloride channel family protein